VVGDDGEEGLNDMYHENQMLTKETQNLRTRIKAMQVRRGNTPIHITVFINQGKKSRMWTMLFS
jgi:hypothetical protein